MYWHTVVKQNYLVTDFFVTLIFLVWYILCIFVRVNPIKYLSVCLLVTQDCAWPSTCPCFGLVKVSGCNLVHWFKLCISHTFHVSTWAPVEGLCAWLRNTVALLVGDRGVCTDWLWLCVYAWASSLCHLFVFEDTTSSPTLSWLRHHLPHFLWTHSRHFLREHTNLKFQYLRLLSPL